MLIYVHVPFCRSKCRYCAFYSEAPGPESFAAYTEALLRELHHQAGVLGFSAPTSIFFGGGTPSLLPTQFLDQILNALAARFSLGSDTEISLEANPDSLTLPGRAADLKALGITRLSIGVQSFHPGRLKLLGRAHTAGQARKAVDAARTAGFANISLDCIRGLPGAGAVPAHTRKSWLWELQQAVALEPQHISAYCLTLEPGTPLCAGAGALRFPAESTQTAMFHEGAAYLASQGFLQYEVSNFARAGFTCRHNQGYWRGEDYLGLGPGAVSTIAATRSTNAPDFARWRAACLNGRFDAVETEALSRGTLLLEHLMLGLRTVEGIDPRVWESLSGQTFAQAYGTLPQDLVAAGLAVCTPQRFALTPRGLAVADAVIERFV